MHDGVCENDSVGKVEINDVGSVDFYVNDKSSFITVQTNETRTDQRSGQKSNFSNGR